MSAPEVTTHVSAPSTVRTPAATLELQHGLRDRVHPVQVTLREQPAVRVHRQPPARRVAPLRTRSPPPPRSANPSPSRPISTVLVKQS